jgi:tRNA(Ile)-lysidine synthase
MNIGSIVLDFLNAHNAQNSTLIVAVSGGKDSMTLLYTLQQLQLNIIAAHCNFKLRGDESDGDELLVETYCRNNNIRLEKIAFNTTQEAQQRNLSIQETARTLRYNWFEEIRVQHHADYILTAHHANDVAETFLHNLARGAGVKGLGGIPAKNKTVLRPMLSILTSSINEYVTQNEIPYRDDSSNANDKYTRNFIRHHVIPLLQNVNTKAIEHINHAAKILNETQIIMDEFLRGKASMYYSLTNDILTIKLHPLKKEPYAYTLLYSILCEYHFNTDTINDMLQTTTSGKKWLSKTHVAYLNKAELLINPIESYQHPIQLSFNEIPHEVNFGKNTYQFKILEDTPTLFETNKLYIDYEAINFPLLLRTWQTGDKFAPLGMKNSKKLSDFFTDLKLSEFQKRTCMVMACENKILAVAPYRIDNKAKTNEFTRKTLIIEKVS